MFPSTSLRFDGSSGGRFPSLEDDVEAGCYRLDDGRCPPEKVGQSSSHDGCVLSSIDERENMRPSVLPVRGRYCQCLLLADVVEAGRSRRVNRRCLSEKDGQSSSHDGYVLNCVDEGHNMRPSVPIHGRPINYIDEISCVKVPTVPARPSDNNLRAFEIIDDAYAALSESIVHSPLISTEHPILSDNLSAFEVIDNAYYALAESVFCSLALPSVHTSAALLIPVCLRFVMVTRMKPY